MGETNRLRSRRYWLLAILVLGVCFGFDFQLAFAWFVWTSEIVFRLSKPTDLCTQWTGESFSGNLILGIENRDLDRGVIIPPQPITEIQADNYSYDLLEKLSQGWSQPVVVRGLFAHSRAVALWGDPEYLIDNAFGGNETSVVHNGTRGLYYINLCNSSFEFSREKAFNVTIHNIAHGSLETIVYPPASRSKRVRNQLLEVAWNRLVEHDIDLRLIGGGFVSGVKNTVLTQMFLGGSSTEKDSLGTAWHCDICNNFIVQASGIKRWTMVDPKYSVFMRPQMKAGKTAIAMGNDANVNYVPHLETDLYPGDMMYNPEWYWHSIENRPHQNYSLGLVSRECHILRNLKSNALFSSLILLNHALAAMTDYEARQRLISALTGRSLMNPEEAVNIAKETEIKSGYI